MLVQCPTLKDDYKDSLTAAGELPMGDLFTRFTDLEIEYTRCAIRQDCLIQAASDQEKKTCPELDAFDKQVKDVKADATK